jgi:predicted small secreted protein
VFGASLKLNHPGLGSFCYFNTVMFSTTIERVNMFSYWSLKRSTLMVLLAMIFVSLSVAGCGTLGNGRGWGQDAIYPVDLKRFPRAAFNALLYLQTLIPAAGHCFVCAAEREKEIIIVALLGSPSRGHLWKETEALIDKGFQMIANKKRL